jgi:hypothetical protein
MYATDKNLPGAARSAFCQDALYIFGQYLYDIALPSFSINKPAAIFLKWMKPAIASCDELVQFASFPKRRMETFMCRTLGNKQCFQTLFADTPTDVKYLIYLKRHGSR